MAVLIPHPIPEPERTRLIEAGRHAMEAWNRDQPDTWRQRHGKVEKIIEEIRARYGFEEQENEV